MLCSSSNIPAVTQRVLCEGVWRALLERSLKNKIHGACVHLARSVEGVLKQVMPLIERGAGGPLPDSNDDDSQRIISPAGVKKVLIEVNRLWQEVIIDGDSPSEIYERGTSVLKN